VSAQIILLDSLKREEFNWISRFKIVKSQIVPSHNSSNF
jgi:hypothetical protein